MTFFDDVKNSTGDFFGSTDVGGFVLGLMLMIVLYIALELVFLGLQKDGDGDYKPSAPVFWVSVFAGVVIAILVDWWPEWTGIFLVLIMAFVLIKPLGGGEGA